MAKVAANIPQPAPVTYTITLSSEEYWTIFSLIAQASPQQMILGALRQEVRQDLHRTLVPYASQASAHRPIQRPHHFSEQPSAAPDGQLG